MSGGNYIEIAGGSITEVTDGDYNIYAGQNVVNTASQSVVEVGVNKGVKFGDPDQPPQSLIDARCIVLFRPHAAWKGEYGFDWFRGGDTGMDTDPNWFGKIVGKHYDNATYKQLYLDTNSWSPFFKEDWKMYDRILHSYKNYPIIWKKKVKGNIYLYPVPVLTMLKGEKHRLTLKVEVDLAPQKLQIKQKKASVNDPDYFHFNVTDLPIKNGKYPLENFLEITCTKSFKHDQTIEVLADDKPCGWLTVKANDVSVHKHIPIVIVNVITKNGANTTKGQIVSGGEAFFKQGLKQAYVFPTNNTIERLPADLDVTAPLGLNKASLFEREYCDSKGIAYSYGKTLRQPMLDFLDRFLEMQYPGKYTNHYKLYFIAQTYNTTVAGKPGFIIQGFSNFNTLHGVYFNGHDKSTVTHETLHALGLPHTFDGISPEAKFTYKAQQTDNLMDYCHWHYDILGNPRKSVQGKTLFYWQMEVLNPKLKNTK